MAQITPLMWFQILTVSRIYTGQRHFPPPLWVWGTSFTTLYAYYRLLPSLQLAWGLGLCSGERRFWHTVTCSLALLRLLAYICFWTTNALSVAALSPLFTFYRTTPPLTLQQSNAWRPVLKLFLIMVMHVSMKCPTPPLPGQGGD